MLPQNLDEALDALEKDTVICEALGPIAGEFLRSSAWNGSSTCATSRTGKSGATWNSSERTDEAPLRFRRSRINESKTTKEKHVWNRRTAGEETGAAGEARRADGADADRHDRARPDSAGMAVFGTPLPTARKISLYSGLTDDGAAYDWAAWWPRAQRHAGRQRHASTIKGNHAILGFDGPDGGQAWIKEHDPKLHVLSAGRSIELYKDIGTPAEVAARYDFGALTGSHLVGHTRMATESAVTPDRAHPFTAGEDFCLVHNGSLSNPNGVRRMLEPRGIRFETDNDTEAACRFLEWRLREGDDLEAALQKGFEELDGFYTFLMGTADKLALIRDPFACKPAVVAETDDYVAIASEFRSLAHLPGVKHANVFEPAPEEMYVWNA
jgi:hypothetical protein